MHRAKDKRLDSMPTCNLVVRVRARQMNRPDTRIDDPLRRPDRIACSF